MEWRWDFGQRRGFEKGFSLYQKSLLKATICLLLGEDPPSVPAGRKAGMADPAMSQASHVEANAVFQQA